jgi:hypothetical protein
MHSQYGEHEVVGEELHRYTVSMVSMKYVVSRKYTDTQSVW